MGSNGFVGGKGDRELCARRHQGNLTEVRRFRAECGENSLPTRFFSGRRKYLDCKKYVVYIDPKHFFFRLIICVYLFLWFFGFLLGVSVFLLVVWAFFVQFLFSINHLFAVYYFLLFCDFVSFFRFFFHLFLSFPHPLRSTVIRYATSPSGVQFQFHRISRLILAFFLVFFLQNWDLSLVTESCGIFVRCRFHGSAPRAPRNQTA